MAKSMEAEQLKNEKYLENKYGDLLNETESLEDMKEYEAESYTLEIKTPMGKVQRELTPQKVKVCIQKLANSKTIEAMVNSLDTSKLVTMFENEKEFFEKVVENIVKKEASVLKVNEKELQAEEKKQKVEDVQLSI
jgi:DNA replication initiation complex subunit (GINS family)